MFKKSLAEHHDLYVDLTQTYHGMWQGLLRHAKNPTGIRKGERIRVGDHTGRRAIAEVISVHTNGVVILDVDANTYYEVQ